jgi:hypothetical protein
MAYKITQTYTRPNTDISWFSDSAPDHPASRIALEVFTSSDGLTQTVISLWESQADWESIWNDAAIQDWVKRRLEYNSKNGITLVVNRETI